MQSTQAGRFEYVIEEIVAMLGELIFDGLGEVLAIQAARPTSRDDICDEGLLLGTFQRMYELDSLFASLSRLRAQPHLDLRAAQLRTG